MYSHCFSMLHHCTKSLLWYWQKKYNSHNKMEQTNNSPASVKELSERKKTTRESHWKWILSTLPSSALYFLDRSFFSQIHFVAIYSDLVKWNSKTISSTYSISTSQITIYFFVNCFTFIFKWLFFFARDVNEKKVLFDSKMGTKW